MERSVFHEVPAQVRGRALFDLHCATCHGPSGEGSYLSPAVRPPAIAGRSPQVVKVQVRRGLGEMPAFSPAILPDADLADLAGYVSYTLAESAVLPEMPRGGRSAPSPVALGMLVWSSLLVFCVGMALLFGPGRN
jgi:mono/diheme cytochrome c family protein